MIVCQCTGISDKDIHSAIEWMRASDPDTVITPGKIYRTLGKKADCGGCMPLFMNTMSACPSLKIPSDYQQGRPRKWKTHERR